MYAFKRGQTSVILRVKLFDSTSTTGAGLTGLTSASAGLIISTIADNEDTAVAYAVASSKVESISTLGTFAAPTATKCRFKEVDATNHKGIYEIQIDNARYAVSNAKSLIVSWSGATNLAQGDIHIPLQTIDPYDVQSLFTSAVTEAYNADGSPPTLAQFMCLMLAKEFEMSIVGTTMTCNKLDGSTPAATALLDSATAPTSITRSS